MAFPTQKQEAFFEGHVQAFHFLGGIPRRISYDNLKAAVQRVLTGRNRKEQESFIVFRSHYLFESRYCTPGQGHEKGAAREIESGPSHVVPDGHLSRGVRNRTQQANDQKGPKPSADEKP